MKNLKESIRTYWTGKKLLGLFILTNFVYVLMILVTIPKTMAFADGMQLLDMMPMGYDADYISTLFNKLGQEGRDTYLYRQLPLDLIYPFLFGLCFSAVFLYCLQKLGKGHSPFSSLAYLPIIGGGADYLENFGTILMLNSFPQLSTTLMTATSGFTIIKSIATSIYFIALIVLLLLLALQYWRKRNET